jgi:hypothetical protein
MTGVGTPVSRPISCTAVINASISKRRPRSLGPDERLKFLSASVNYLLIYLLAGLAGSLASLLWRPDINSAGASGAIFGILGALLAAQLRAGDTFPPDIVRPAQNGLVVSWLVLVRRF